MSDQDQRRKDSRYPREYAARLVSVVCAANAETEVSELLHKLVSACRELPKETEVDPQAVLADLYLENSALMVRLGGFGK